MPHSYVSLTHTLAEAGIEEPESEAALLLEAFAVEGQALSYASLLADRSRLYNTPALESAVKRRLSHEPLQYILGKWSFYGHIFEVNEHCLVPRPDTEILVDAAVRTLPRGAHIVDLCTGSGCIAISVLKARPDITADALELYPDTLALATRNAEALGVTDRFTPILADVLHEGCQILAERGPYDAILSNPPYIPTRVVDTLSPEVAHEPRVALDGGEDGLTFYRAILKNYPSLLRPNGHILLEMGWDQAEALKSLASAMLPDASAAVIRDLAGKDRVMTLHLPTCGKE